MCGETRYKTLSHRFSRCWWLLITVPNLLAGCYQTVPEWRGTWTGEAVPITVYGQNGKTFRAITIDVPKEDYPKPKGSWKEPTFTEEELTYLNTLPENHPILVDRNQKILDLPGIQQGDIIQVDGIWRLWAVGGPEGGAVYRSPPTPKSSAGMKGIMVKDVVKVMP